MEEALSVDSMLEKALEGSNAEGKSDAVVVALHASLLAEGFQLIAVEDEVINCIYIPCQCIHLTCVYGVFRYT